MLKNTETSQSPSNEGSDTVETQKIDTPINPDLCYRKKPVFSFFKRFFDIINSSLAIIVLSPLLLVIALLVACTSKGPVFYKHLRMGRNGKPFYMLKFRSMIWDQRPIEQQFDPEQLKQFQTRFKVDNDPRITKVGKFLRKTSLDELPQLFNIFIGQMSVVGPRPIIAMESEKYGTNKSLLLSIRPGLTSYWACHGRSNVTYQKRMNMELYYVTHRSLLFDFNIICRTAISVFLRDGAE
jgi:lipopolysaccharide/colanic/teichoic acid biosynthesis glycosyltransferase